MLSAIIATHDSERALVPTLAALVQARGCARHERGQSRHQRPFGIVCGNDRAQHSGTTGESRHLITRCRLGSAGCAISPPKFWAMRGPKRKEAARRRPLRSTMRVGLEVIVDADARDLILELAARGDAG